MTESKPNRRTRVVWLAVAVAVVALIAVGWSGLANRRRLQLARTHMESGAYKLARQELAACGWMLAFGREDLAAELDRREIRWYNQRAQEELKQSRFGPAADAFRQALKAFPKEKTFLQGLQDVKTAWSREIRHLVDGGKVERARTEVGFAESHFPRQMRRMWLGEILAEENLRDGQMEEDLQHYEVAAQYYRQGLTRTGDARRREALQEALDSLVSSRATEARRCAADGYDQAAISLYRQAGRLAGEPDRFAREIEAIQSALATKALAGAAKSAQLVRKAAEVSRTEALAAKADSLAADAWRQAEDLRRLAETIQPKDKAGYDRLRVAWDKARQGYESATASAARITARAAAEAARKLAQAAREKAAAVAASENAPDSWAEAESYRTQAEELFATKKTTSLRRADGLWRRASRVYDIAEGVAKSAMERKTASNAPENVRHAREAAQLARRDAEIARNNAKAVDAETHAKDRWDQANELFRAGVTEYGGRRYLDARRSWLRAKELFIAATGAGGAASAKQQYDRLVQEHADTLAADGGAQWQAIKAQAALAEGAYIVRDFDKAGREYRRLVATLEKLLPGAKDRNATRTRSLRARGMVVSARDLLASASYSEALKRVSAAVELEPSMAEASALQQELGEYLLRYRSGPTLAGHSGAATAVAFSPDGKQVVSVGTDQVARVWDLARQRSVWQWNEHTKAIHAVAWAPNGRWIATGGEDETVRVWDTQTGKRMLLLTGHTAAVNSLAFSPDSSQLLSGSDDATSRVWNVVTGQQQLVLKGHAVEVHAVAWSPDGKYLATAGKDKVVILYNAADGRQVRSLVGHTSPIACVAFSPYGTRVASAGGEEIRLWDVTTGQGVRTMTDTDDVITSVAFSPSGRRLVSGAGVGVRKILQSNSVKVWDVGRGRVLQTLTGPGDRVTGVAFRPDGREIVATSRDRKVYLFVSK